MEARILPLPTPVPTPASIGAPVPVRIDGDRIVVERLVVVDAALAASLADREPAERPAVVERALRIGLLAMQDASRASLRLLAASGDDEPALRVVIAADVGDTAVTPRPELDRAVISVSDAVLWPAVAAVHVDGADAESAVRAAAAVIDAADLGDDDAEFALGSAEDFDLAWYAPGEIRYLVEELDAR